MTDLEMSILLGGVGIGFAAGVLSTAVWIRILLWKDNRSARRAEEIATLEERFWGSFPVDRGDA